MVKPVGGTARDKGQRVGKFREGKWYCVCHRVNVGECMCSSAHSCGCVADGGMLWWLLEYYYCD